MMMKNNVPARLRDLYWKAKSESTSPYNDGWTQQYYTEILESIEKEYGELGFNYENDTTEYSINIPANIVECLEISAGDKLLWSVLPDGSCVLRKVQNENLIEVEIV